MTAATVHDSVGRWRIDLDPVEADLITQSLEATLEALDYPT